MVFSDDATIWNRITLPELYDSIIQQQLNRIMNYKTSFTLGTHDNYDYTTRDKFRWIDPLVMTKGGERPLSSIDRTFAQEVKLQKMRFSDPHYILYVQ